MQLLVETGCYLFCLCGGHSLQQFFPEKKNARYCRIEVWLWAAAKTDKGGFMGAVVLLKWHNG